MARAWADVYTDGSTNPIPDHVRQGWAMLERSLHARTRLAQMPCLCTPPGSRNPSLNSIMELLSVLSLPLLPRFKTHNYLCQVLSLHLRPQRSGHTGSGLAYHASCTAPLLRLLSFDQSCARDRRRCKAATPPQRPAQSKPRAKQLLSTQAHSQR